MYQGNYVKSNAKRNAPRKKRMLFRKEFVVLCSVLTLLIGVIGGTLAYLTTKTDPVINTFTPAKTDTEITEEIDSGVKNNVQVKNKGDIDAYVRAAVVVTWVDSEGNVIPAVENVDYQINWTFDKNGWFKSGDIYYYSSPVKANESTGQLFTNCSPIQGKAPEGYNLSVEIMAQSIQAKPTTAVEQAWSVSVADDGMISK